MTKCTIVVTGARRSEEVEDEQFADLLDRDHRTASRRATLPMCPTTGPRTCSL